MLMVEGGGRFAQQIVVVKSFTGFAAIWMVLEKRCKKGTYSNRKSCKSHFGSAQKALKKGLNDTNFRSKRPNF